MEAEMRTDPQGKQLAKLDSEDSEEEEDVDIKC
jgi:hypothetical protein